MSTTAKKKSSASTLHRPKASTVFAAAFLAGAAAAVAVNRAFDVHLAQSVPQVESEPIFVALRSLPKGAPVSIYDVALKDWPTAMMPSTALRADANFEHVVLRHPVQEGQPILSLQLAEVRPEPTQQIAATAQPGESLPTKNPQQSAPAFVPYSAPAPVPAATAPTAQAAATPTRQSSPELNERAAPVTEAVPDKSVATASPTPAIPAPAAETVAAATNETVVSKETTPPATTPTPSRAPLHDVDAPLQFAAAEATPVADITAESRSVTPEPVQTAAVTTGDAETPPETPAATTSPREETVVATDEPTGPQESEVAAAVEPALELATAAAEASTATDETPAASAEMITETATAKPETRANVPTAVEPIDVTASVLARAESVNTPGASQTPPVTADVPGKEGAEPNQAANGSGMMRYLVVPERIALQVDHSFTRQKPPAAPQRKPSPSPNQSRGGVKPLPQTTAGAQRTPGRPTPAATANRTGQPTQLMQATAGNAPRSNRPAASRNQPARPPANRQATNVDSSAKPVEREPMLRSLFPNLSAGLSAMGDEWRNFRNRNPEVEGTEQEQRQANRQESSQQRSR